MSNFYRQLQDLLDQGLDVAVATITQTKGSTPRGVGTKMIIHPYGKHVGTVGGGCGEADVIRAGLDVLADGQPRTVLVDLTEDISMQSLGVCGGILTRLCRTLVRRTVWPTMNDQQILEAMLASLDQRRPVALVTAIAGSGVYAGQVGRRLIVWSDPSQPAQGDLAPAGLGDQRSGRCTRRLGRTRSARSSRVPA